MRIDVMNDDRQCIGRAEVDSAAPPASVGDVAIDWTDCIDPADGSVRQCPVCRNRELFIRKDFPQRLGMAIVVIAGVAAFVLFTLHHVIAAAAVLVAMAVVDLAIYLMTGKALVCYRCRSEFRGMAFRDDQAGWSLETGEKYRHLLKNEAEHADFQHRGSREG